MKNNFVGFYLKKANVIANSSISSLPIRVEKIPGDGTCYSMKTEGHAFVIPRNTLKKNFKKCPQSQINVRIEYLLQKLGIYEKD